jgi:hypothetical protein
MSGGVAVMKEKATMAALMATNSGNGDGGDDEDDGAVPSAVPASLHPINTASPYPFHVPCR